MAQEKNEKMPFQDLSIEIDDATAQGLYANLALISHSETEFVLDFVFHSPQPPKAKVRARILTSPAHMRRFLAALQDNIAKYEARFGPIKAGDPAKGPEAPRMGFYH
jgi:hypothetical protein